MNFRSGGNLRWMSRGSFCDLFGIFHFIVKPVLCFTFTLRISEEEKEERRRRGL